jgi:disulfide bond formation protein DsbB
MRRLIAAVGREPRLQLLGLGLAGCALVGCGLYLARTLNIAACPLCILQRMVYLLLGAEALLALFVVRGTRLLAGLMAATAATGAWIAAYQTWLQRFSPSTDCSANQPWWEQLVNWAGTQVPWLFEATGFCTEAGWRFLGLSIAEWSLAMFSLMALLALRVLLSRR